MLTIMNDLPANVLAVSATGEVTGSDYEKVLIPAFQEKLKTVKKLRFLYHLGDSFQGFSLAAMLDDARVGIGHPLSWEKIAFVSDHEMLNTFARFFSHFISGDVRIFKNADLDKAKLWIAES